MVGWVRRRLRTKKTCDRGLASPLVLAIRSLRSRVCGQYVRFYEKEDAGQDRRSVLLSDALFDSSVNAKSALASRQYRAVEATSAGLAPASE